MTVKSKKVVTCRVCGKSGNVGSTHECWLTWDYVVAQAKQGYIVGRGA